MCIRDRLGGAGGTAGLCVLMFFLAKSQRYKTLGKLALPIGLCGINEPITFGVPMVMNTIMLIPMMLTPMLTFGLSYALTSMGILPIMNGTEMCIRDRCSLFWFQYQKKSNAWCCQRVSHFGFCGNDA